MSKSYWMATTDLPRYEPLARRTIRADVAIVGGGIAGLTAAFLLKRSGLRVAVLDRGRVGSHHRSPDSVSRFAVLRAQVQIRQEGRSPGGDLERRRDPPDRGAGRRPGDRLRIYEGRRIPLYRKGTWSSRARKRAQGDGE